MQEALATEAVVVCNDATLSGDGLMKRLGELTIPAIAVCEHGNIIAANEIHEVLRGSSVDRIIGLHLREVVGEKFSVPTLALVRRVLADCRPRTALVMWRGHWIRVRYTCVTFNATDSVLIHIDPWRVAVWESTPADEEPPEEFRVHDLGDLGVLSVREAEVLWMIGQGMSLPKVAKELSRSTKTIESHVRAIGSKVKVRGRFGMGLFAKERGLCNMTREQIGRVFAERPSSRAAFEVD